MSRRATAAELMIAATNARRNAERHRASARSLRPESWQAKADLRIAAKADALADEMCVLAASVETRAKRAVRL
jgi:hypothetical protein